MTQGLDEWRVDVKRKIPFGGLVHTLSIGYAGPNQVEIRSNLVSLVAGQMKSDNTQYTNTYILKLPPQLRDRITMWILSQRRYGKINGRVGISPASSLLSDLSKSACSRSPFAH